MAGKFDLSATLAKVENETPAVRSIDDLTRDILRNKQRAGVAILEIGKALIEAKELLPHGEWLPWLREQVELSERGAQMYMQLARSGLNPQLVADLGLKKSAKLLALEPHEREAFIAEPHVVGGEQRNVAEMSAAQVEMVVKEHTAARAAPTTEADRDTPPAPPSPGPTFGDLLRSSGNYDQAAILSRAWGLNPHAVKAWLGMEVPA